MKILFYNNYENRLRTVWRLLIFTALLLFFTLIITVFISNGLNFAFIAAIVSLVLLWFFSSKIDKRPLSEYGYHSPVQWIKDFSAGYLMAALAMGTIVLIKAGMGWIIIENLQFNLFEYTFTAGLIYTFALMTAVSIWEETYFRSYLITNLKDGLFGTWIGKSGAMIFAVLISSLFFGLLHIGNPNSSWISTLNISIAGMVFAYPYIVTKSVAIPIGMHLSWNYFQGAVFGLPVSGTQFDHMMMVVNVTGPEAFTGGSFGPEAGASGLLGLMLLLTFSEIYITLFYKK